MRGCHVGRLALALTAAAVVAGAASAAGAERSAEVASERNVTVAGVQVAIDPATGRLRQPTAEESRQLLQALARQFGATAKSTQTTTWADGTLSAVLGEDTMNVALARLDGNGAVAQACVDSLEQAAQFLQGDAALEEK